MLTYSVNMEHMKNANNVDTDVLFFKINTKIQDDISLLCPISMSLGHD